MPTSATRASHSGISHLWLYYNLCIRSGEDSICIPVHSFWASNVGTQIVAVCHQENIYLALFL